MYFDHKIYSFLHQKSPSYQYQEGRSKYEPNTKAQKSSFTKKIKSTGNEVAMAPPKRATTGHCSTALMSSGILPPTHKWAAGL